MRYNQRGGVAGLSSDRLPQPPLGATNNSYSSHTGIDLGFSNKTSNAYTSLLGGLQEVTEAELALTP